MSIGRGWFPENPEDEREEFQSLTTCLLEKKLGEVWTFPNLQVHAEKNITMGRIIQPIL